MSDTEIVIYKCEDCLGGPCILKASRQFENDVPKECPFANGAECNWGPVEEKDK